MGLHRNDFPVQGHTLGTLLSLLSLGTGPPSSFVGSRTLFEVRGPAPGCRGPTPPHGGMRAVCVWHVPSGGAWLRHAWEPAWSLALGVVHRCPSRGQVSDPSLSLIHNLWAALGDRVGVLSSLDTPVLGQSLLVPSLAVVTGTYSRPPSS